MFGYVKPFKPDMKMREFEAYQSVYCGLCRQLGRSFGPFAKLTLSYDFTFLSMLAMAMSDEEPKSQTGACPANPFKKRLFVKENAASEFSADCAMIIFYYKVKDSLADRGFLEKLRAVFAYPFAALARKKAAKRQPDIDAAMAQTTKSQAKIEHAGSALTDEAAQPTAQSLSIIFSMLTDDNVQKRVLTQLGYLLGRYIYLCDAFDDIEKDIKLKNYNPFVISSKEKPADEIYAQAKASLNLTMAAISAAYELLNIRRFKTILDNIIYQGLPSTVQSIVQKYSSNCPKSEGE